MAKVRKLLVCCGGRHLTQSSNPAAYKRIMGAVDGYAPTHVIVGNQRGGDELWQHVVTRMSRAEAQLLVVEPTQALLDAEGGAAYRARTKLLWELAQALWTSSEVAVACFALPGGPGTTLCTREAEKLGVEVTRFPWEP